MRIALVHSFYDSSLPSGENTVVLEQVDALTEAGHDVLLVARRTDEDRHQPLYELRSAARVVTGRGPDPTEELRAFRPDVIHLHNLFPNFGTRWLRAWTGPVVATLHNFRPICANGLLYRDGHYCEECPTGSHLAAVRHACYHDSRVASLPLAIRNSRGALSNDVLARADALICLSEQAADTYRRLAGVDLPLHVVPNGIDIDLPATAATPNDRWLVVSRLTPEKGVLELVKAWPEDEQLDIIGDGPGASDLRTANRTNVALLGSLPRDEVLAVMPNYLGLVFPSRCVEMQPTVLSEAMASGLPIIALAGNAGRMFINVGAGEEYSDDTLAAALSRARSAHRNLQAHARKVGEQLGHDAWLQSLLKLYAQLGRACEG